MEQEKLSPEMGRVQDKTLDSEAEKSPEDMNPFAEFLSFHKERSRSKKSGLPGDELDDRLKNELNKVMKSPRYRNELFDLFVEYWCTTLSVNLRSLIHDVERSVIINILRKVNGNQKIAAKALGICPTTLNEKLKKHGIYFRKAPFIDK